jgi:hypothetical protein
MYYMCIVPFFQILSLSGRLDKEVTISYQYHIGGKYEVNRSLTPQLQFSDEDTRNGTSSSVHSQNVPHFL